MTKKTITLNELRSIVKQIIKETSYYDHSDRYTEDEFLESPEYFIDTYTNGQFGQLKTMLDNFRSNGRMEELLGYINEVGQEEIKDWIIKNI